MKLRLIQVGLGTWGLSWTEVVRRRAEVGLVGLVDPEAPALEAARAIASLPQGRCFADLAEALSGVECDAVLITAGLGAHAPLAEAALRAGKHVLVEKPFVETAAEAGRLADLAAGQGRVLMVSQNYRFYPAARAARALVAEQRLGAVVAVDLDFRQNAPAFVPAGHRYYSSRQPLLMDMSIHHFDLLRAVLGREPLQIRCSGYQPAGSPFRDPPAASALIDFAGGVMVRYHATWLSPGPLTNWAGAWRIVCTDGEILWTGRNSAGLRGERVALRHGDGSIERVRLPSLPAYDRAGSLAAFAAAVAGGAEPESSGRDNVGSVALMNAAVASAEGSGWVAVG